MGKTHTLLPPDIAEVLKGIEHWRKTRPRPGRMPEGLWSAVVGLVPAHGLNPVARALLSFPAVNRPISAKILPDRKAGLELKCKPISTKQKQTL